VSAIPNTITKKDRREQVPLGHRGHRVVRDDSKDDLGQRRRRLRLRLTARELHAATRAQQVRDREPDQPGERRRHGRARPSPADAPELRRRELSDPGEQREDDDRDDEHVEQAQKEVTERFDDGHHPLTEDRASERSEEERDRDAVDERYRSIPTPQRSDETGHIDRCESAGKRLRYGRQLKRPVTPYSAKITRTHRRGSGC